MAAENSIAQGEQSVSKLIQILALVLFLFPVAVNADPLVLINFDTPLPNDLYSSQGVVLTTVGISQPSGRGTLVITNLRLLATPAAISPPQAAFAVGVNPLFSGVTGIMGDFVFKIPEGIVVPAATQSVSFNVVGSQGTWTALFFDQTNKGSFDVQTGLIATITGNTDQLVVFSHAAGIRRFIFIPSGLNVLEGIDNLQFEATSVPEPSSVILITLGVGGLLARKRLRRSA